MNFTSVRFDSSHTLFTSSSHVVQERKRVPGFASLVSVADWPLRRQNYSPLSGETCREFSNRDQQKSAKGHARARSLALSIKRRLSLEGDRRRPSFEHTSKSPALSSAPSLPILSASPSVRPSDCAPPTSVRPSASVRWVRRPRRHRRRLARFPLSLRPSVRPSVRPSCSDRSVGVPRAKEH